MGPWDPSVIGPIAGAVMTLGIAAAMAGVMIFRPLTTQLGELLEQMRRDRQHQGELENQARIAQLMESVLDRLERLEARQDFAERVIESAGWKNESSAALPRRRSVEQRGRTEE